MAITRVDDDAVDFAASALTATKVIGAAIPAGALGIAYISWDTTTGRTLSSFVDDAGNNWVFVDTQTDSTDQQAVSRYKAVRMKAAAAGTVTLTATFSSASDFRLIAYEIVQGAADINVFTSQTAANTTAADNATSGSVTPTVDGAFIAGMVVNTSGPTVPANGSGFTPRTTTGTGGGPASLMEDRVQTTRTAVAATATISVAGRYIAFVAALTPDGPVPTQPRRRWIPWPPRRRAATQPVPSAAVVVTTQTLPPQPPRPRSAFRPRRVSEFTTPVPMVIVTVPPPRRRRTILPPHLRRATATPVAVTVTVTTQALPPQPTRRGRFQLPRVKARASQPVPVLVVTAQALPPQPVRRLQPLRIRTRSEFTVPVPPAVVTQALPPQQPRTVRHEWIGRRRARVAVFIPSGTPAPTTQALPAQSARRPSRPPLRRQTETTLVLATRISLPPQPQRPTGHGWLPRRRPRIAAVPPVQVIVTVPTLQRRRSTLLLRRPRYVVGPPIRLIVTAQALPPQQPRRQYWRPWRRHPIVAIVVEGGQAPPPPTGPKYPVTPSDVTDPPLPVTGSTSGQHPVTPT